MATADAPVIYWFRQDLRLTDLPGLLAASKTGCPVIPCFVLDDAAAGEWAPGGASRWWLHHSLAALDSQLAQYGTSLHLLRGDSVSNLLTLAEHTGARRIFSSRLVEPWQRELESALHEACEAQGLEYRRFAGNLLWEPEAVATKTGQPFKVYTPFRRACQALEPPGVATRPRRLPEFLCPPGGLELEALELTPRDPDWAREWLRLWRPGEDGARASLQRFLGKGLLDYSEGRDHPARDATSRLSPHLQWGEISPRQLWRRTTETMAKTPGRASQVEKFQSELLWREFNHHLLFHFPHTTQEPFQAQFKAFPWGGDPAHLPAWQRGTTGYPLVDAGMRELWQTGYMHNRVRMVCASFLTKHLLLPWQLGARWFWDTLVDASLANNSGGWQWAAGSGADAAPYFRIFNPVLQGDKFDETGAYTRRWVPELAAMPDRYLQQPWQAQAQVLQDAGVALGTTYPAPIVDHREARESALAAYGAMREAS